ncbi:hypothetical protein OI25_7509 [Paraburkholderia fungorum]|uniref:Uncharacterized protein n=1 Tax=Paraburkholderia fungorum TaxID=134537 RepID=A0AAU8SZR4_9BURK|nr:hypothetical protein [Paraburkholderia fungorum]AJZ56994.1 hypothetical protein OI25_7509 [Paraburkholderia fungorum]
MSELFSDLERVSDEAGNDVTHGTGEHTRYRWWIRSIKAFVSFLKSVKAGRVDEFRLLIGYVWPARTPADASPTSSQMPAHGSEPMWFAIPSSQWTCTTYSLPVSRRTCVKTH